MDLSDVQELMGHTSAKTTARYARVEPKTLLRAVEFLSEPEVDQRQKRA